jgi:hypothetical protein
VVAVAARVIAGAMTASFVPAVAQLLRGMRASRPVVVTVGGGFMRGR